MEQPPPQTAPPAVDRQPRVQLLSAAAAVFAEKGYKDATVRDICGRAGANLNAINYYFQDKERLYLAVIDHLLAETRDLFFDFGADPSFSPQERLRAFIATRIHAMSSFAGPITLLIQIMTREVLEPTVALDVVGERQIKPVLAYLNGLLAEIMGPGAEPRQIAMAAPSIMGQCLIYTRLRSVAQRLRPPGAPEITPDEVIDHITHFSLEGLLHMAPPPPGPGEN